MKRYAMMAWVLGIIMLCAGCGSLPYKKTLELKRPETAQATQQPQGQAVAFELDNIFEPQLSKLDPDMYLSNPRELLLGWYDNQKLLALHIEDGTGPDGGRTQHDEDDMMDDQAVFALTEKGQAGEQQLFNSSSLAEAEMALTFEYQAVALDANSFMEVLFDLPGPRLGMALSHDSSMLAWLYDDAGMPTLQIYNVANGDIICAVQLPHIRLTTELVWSNNDYYVGFLTNDANSAVCMLRADSEVDGPDTVLTLEEFASLSDSDNITGILFIDDVKMQMNLSFLHKKDESMMLHFQFWTGGNVPPSVHGYPGEGVFQFYDGETIIVLADDELYVYQINAGEAYAVARGVTAFSLSQDRKYICYSRMSADYSGRDIYVAHVEGQQLSGEKSVYKGLVSDGRLMMFSPDGHRLLISGLRRMTSTNAVTMVLEFR